MKHRILSIIVSFFFLTPLCFATSFSDVTSGYKFFPSISALSDAGLVKGYSDGSFKPEATVNRAELLKMIMGSEISPGVLADYGNKLNTGALISPFYDVKAADWFAPYVIAAQQMGVIQGYADGSFKPGQAVNLAEGLKIMLNSAKVNLSEAVFSPRNLRFVKAGDWFAPYFAYADSKKILQSTKFYHGAQGVTRGELSEMVYRLRQVQISGQPYPEKQLSSSDYYITIPRLNVINVKVSLGDPYDGKKSLEALKSGLGYYLATPGSGKRMVLFGHSSGYSWDSSAFKTILRQIDQLKVGDDIYVNYHERGYHYVVRTHEILPAAQDYVMMEDKGKEEMALYTCWPPDSIKERYVIYADPA